VGGGGERLNNSVQVEANVRRLIEMSVTPVAFLQSTMPSAILMAILVSSTVCVCEWVRVASGGRSWAMLAL